MRIALTGSTGKLGSVVLRELRDAGHDVVGLDIVGAREPGFVQVDLTDYGQVVDALGGVDRTERFDAVVHLGAVPAPGIRTDVATFHNNMTSTFNVFWAAVHTNTLTTTLLSILSTVFLSAFALLFSKIKPEDE